MELKYYNYTLPFPKEWLISASYHYMQRYSWPETRILDQYIGIVIPDSPVFSDQWNSWKNNLLGNWQILIRGNDTYINFEKEEDHILYSLTYMYNNI